MLIKKVLVLSFLLVMFGSAQAEMTSSDSYKGWNIGIFGAFVPHKNMNVYPGVFVGWSSHIKKYSVGADFRFVWPSDRPHTASEVFQEVEYFFVFLSITARRFFTYGNIMPAIGAGISVGNIEGDRGTIGPSNYEISGSLNGANKGFGAHVTLGADVLRLAKNRVRLEARVDFPFYKSHLSTARVRRLESSYVIPISVDLSYHR
ncbi:MAG: hypothetical protein OXH16_07620 [Gemmatimonadetes bacterium]|nr:hypothetical protein [Gemmatimonadota bacterium]